MQINVKTKYFLTYFNKKIGNYILLDTEHTKILSLLTVFFLSVIFIIKIQGYEKKSLSTKIRVNSVGNFLKRCYSFYLE